MVLSGQRHKQLQESIIASETLCALLDEDTTEVREKVQHVYTYGSCFVSLLVCVCVCVCVCVTS